MEIKTNNVPRELIAYINLPEEERAEFGYIGEDARYDRRFFRYRGQVYDTHEFVRIVKRSQRNVGWAYYGVDDDSPLLAWDGIHVDVLRAARTDTFFSGALVRYTGGYDDRVVVGMVFS